MFKVIWIAGMPRSGSMWTFNVVRETLRRAGFNVLPEEITLDDRQCADYANQEIFANRDPSTIFVFKVHARLSALPPDHLIVTNLRDIRDVTMSYQRFMRVDFERALEICKFSLLIADHYLAFPETQRLVLRYDELTAKPAETIARIADRVAGGIDDKSACEIAAQFSKAKVKALTEDKDRQYRRSLEGEQLPPDEILLRRSDGATTTIDRSTGFQSHHVSDYRDGDWRQLLSAGQIRDMENAFGDWLEKHSFTA